MCKRWNNEDECYEYGHYEDEAFVPDNLDEMIPELIDDIDDPAPVGVDALRNVWNTAD